MNTRDSITGRDGYIVAQALYDDADMNEEITGRDGYIVAQALYVAAKALRSQEYPEESNADDMEAIAEAWFPGSFETRRVRERFQEGLRMGLEMPAGGMTLTSEAVEAWIAEGIAADGGADSEDATTAYLTAHARAFTMQGHLRGTNRISGLSDEDARRELDEARATMARLTPSSAELMHEAETRAAA